MTPFDTRTSEGRSRERLRRALLTTVSALLGRVIAIAGPMITVPLALGYLGHERYGLWMTVTGIIGMFSFADLGLGNGLMTEISQADGRGDEEESRRCVTSALLALSGIGVLLLCAYVVIYPLVPWPRVLNATTPALLHESGAVVTACLLSFLINLPLGVVQRTQAGLQEGYRSHLWHCAGLLLNVGVVVAAVRAQAGLPVLVLSVTAVPAFVNLLNGYIFFRYQRPQLLPRFQDFHWATAKRLLRTGFWFLLVSILLAAGLYSDNVVVAQVIGLDSVPLYSIPASLAGYLGAMASMVSGPFWSANGEALARGDVAWVRRSAARLVALNLVVTGLGGVAFVMAGPAFLHWWIGPEFSPGRLLFAGQASWAVLIGAAGPLFMVLNGSNTVRIQVVIFGVFSPIAILLKVILAKELGVAGVVWASVLPYALLVLPAVAWVMRRVLRNMEQKAAQGPELSGPGSVGVQTDRGTSSGNR